MILEVSQMMLLILFDCRFVLRDGNVEVLVQITHLGRTFFTPWVLDLSAYSAWITRAKDSVMSVCNAN